MQVLLLAACLLQSNIYAQNGDALLNEYAEVRALLKKYYQITAQKYGIYNDYDPQKTNNKMRSITVDDGTEASINRKEGVVGDLFENDILLTLRQAKILLKETGKNRNVRQIISSTRHRWLKMPVSYRLGYSDAKWQSLIRNALRHIEMETCIRFSENGSDYDHLLFIRAQGCWSNVGRVGGRQLISIGYGCDGIGIVMHEILHALGLWHEQSRSDRDRYVWINHNNVFPGTQGNFERRTEQSSDNIGQPYDLGSVMHYGSKAFTKNYDRYTIQTRDRHYQHTIGQRQRVSFKDAKMINLLYCKNSCNRYQYCYNGGYTDPNNCDRCKCPTGFGGKNCSLTEKSKTTNCGGEIFADINYQFINGTNLGANVHCVWRIRSTAKVLVYIDKLRLPCKDTCTSYLELKYTTRTVSTGPRFCCDLPRYGIISESGNFIIIYVATVDNYKAYGNHNTSDFILRFKLYDPTLPVTARPATRGLVRKSSKQPTSAPQATTKTIKITQAAWSKWGEWSSCSVSCGGCGVRRRIRACYGGNHCPGSHENMGKCGEKRCPFTTYFSCRGRLVIPCDLMKRLQFSADNNAYIVSDNKNTAVDIYKYKEQYKKSVASDGRICEKYFDYQCSTSKLTLYLDWKNKWSNVDRRGCCVGYHYNGTNCIPN